MRLRVSTRAALLLGLSCAVAVSAALAQTEDVSLQVRANRNGSSAAPQAGLGGVIVWLTPLTPTVANSASTLRPGHYRLVQKDKQFTPHLLVIPTGSSVDFPNLDPFFHNVFSLFNGKRFDLGLYESGSSRNVHFDHDGVSYIFCNIHPEMGAVIVTLSSPYYAITSSDGNVILHAVPSGAYELHIWAEGEDAHDPAARSRKVVISPTQRDLGTVDVTIDARFHPHKNKFGEDYRDPNESLY